VLPVSSDDIVLEAVLENGMKVIGESKIPHSSLINNSPIQSVSTQPRCPKPIPEVIEAIEDADVIVMGPGSLFTSIIPNLLVGGVKEAIMNSPAKKILVTNLMSEPGETDNYSVGDYYKKIIEHTSKGLITHVIANTEMLIEMEEKLYEEQNSKAVLLTSEDRRLFKEDKITIIEGDYIEYKKGYVRHDAYVISKEIVGLIDAKIYRGREKLKTKNKIIEQEDYKVTKVKF
jgi:uncharacterized cofD-like protein